ncbi:MAG: ABC transporter permease [Candidatus Cloacimonetes bacterium]|nr:ABC transporter permease [Candidatus Cloacimonadota bacterium]
MSILLLYIKKFFCSQRHEWLKFDSVFMYLGIIISVGALVTTFIIFEGYEHTLKKAILGVNSHIYFFKPGSSDFSEEDIAEIGDFLSSKKEVNAYQSVVSGQAVASVGERTRGCFFKSIDWQNDTGVSIYKEAIFEGSHELQQENDIVIGKYLAQQLGVSIGDEVQIMSVSSASVGATGIRYKTRKMTIVGFFYSGMFDYDSRYVFMNTDTALFFTNNIYAANLIEVKLQPNYINQAEYLSLSWDKELNGQFQVLSWVYFNGNLFSLLALEKWVLTFIIAFLIVVASFNVITTSLAAIIEKRKEIGILKTIGLSGKKIALIFMTQNSLMSSVCIIAGIFAGIAMGYLISYQTMISLRGEVYLLDKIHIYIDFWKMCLIFAIAFVIINISNFIPLRQISKMKEIDILRQGS